MSNYKPVRYLQLDLERTRQDGIGRVKWYTAKIPIYSVKDFRATGNILYELPLSARWVLDYCIEIMDSHNYISNNALFKMELLRKLEAMNQKLSRNTINKSFKLLCDSDLLIKWDRRGLYRVNPIFWYRGTLADRETDVREVLEFSSKDITEDYRNDLK